MGLSVSGATAVILLGVLLSLSALYPAVMSTYNTQSDAMRDQSDRIVTQLNTEFTTTNATYDATRGQVNVTVTNTGAESLELDRLDTLVDGEYVPPAERRSTVAGRPDTAVVLPNETVRLSISVTTEPERIKLVSKSGVAAIAEVR